MILDIIIVAILGTTIYNGYKNGIISTIFFIVGIILGLTVAWYFFDLSKELINTYFPLGTPWTSIVAAILPVLLVVLLALYLGKLIKKLVDLVTLGIADKLFGMLLGLIKGLIFLGVVEMILRHTSELFHWNLFTSSYLFPIVEPLIDIVFLVLKKIIPFVRDFYNKGIDNL